MNMTKRIFCLALVLVMLTSLAACGGKAHTVPQRETSYDLSVSFDRAEEKDELTKNFRQRPLHALCQPP